jgi:Tol biopolymer transport system component
LTRRTIASAGVAVALAAVALLSIAALAGATPLPGENGRIVLTSEQNQGAQKAELFLLPVPFSTGGGTLSSPLTASPTLRHRHPTWSPDRTMIAYARGPSAGPFDIWVQDLTQPLSATNPKDLTSNGPASSEDRPAWSPDGTHIAFEKDFLAPADRDIVIASAANGSGQTNITNTAGAIEGAPAWDPFGSTIYYEKGNAQGGNVPVDIVKRSISYDAFGTPTAGTETLAVADSGGPEIQPAISPNGDKICYGTGYPGAPSPQVIKVALLTSTPSSGTQVSPTASAPGYDCTWSPDNTLIAYTSGAGSAGNLVMVRADGTSLFETLLAGGANIQTNPDWAPDGRPECPNSTATTTSGKPITLPVQCNDTGPQYERSDVKEFVSDQPQHGQTTQDLAGDPITYTPNANFVGTDFIEIQSFDDFGFGSDKGVIAVTVSAPPSNPPSAAKKCKKKKKRHSASAAKKKCKKKK